MRKGIAGRQVRRFRIRLRMGHTTLEITVQDIEESDIKVQIAVVREGKKVVVSMTPETFPYQRAAGCATNSLLFMQKRQLMFNNQR